VDARLFFGLQPVGGGDVGGEHSRWRLTVRRDVATPNGFLFGGCGLGAGLAALEAATGRPTVWASAQYLSYAAVGDVVDYEVVVVNAGRHVTQARAVARSGGREVLTVNAALGVPHGTLRETWVHRPDVLSPDRCPPRELPPRLAGSILDAVDVRVATGRSLSHLDGTPGSPNSAVWARVPGHREPSAAMLAVFGDYVSGGASQPFGRRTMGRSLDNTLRIVRLVPTEWVLCDIRMHAVFDDYAHGTAFLWSDDGILLAVASQSVSVRFRPSDTSSDGGAPGG